MKIRRLKILGVAMALSALAALAGVALYVVPRNVAPAANRVEDFVVLNEAFFWLDAHVGKLLHFPDRDSENEHLRLIAIDEPSMNPPNDPNHPGLGRFPWDRRVYGSLLERLHQAGAKVVTFDVEFFEPSHNALDDVLFARGMHAQPSILGMSLATTTGGVLGVLKPPPQLLSAALTVGSTTVDNPGGWLLGQPLAITTTDIANHTQLFPSLAVATAAAYEQFKVKPIDGWHARFGDRIIPLDGDGLLMMLPFKTNEHLLGKDQREGAVDESAPFFQAASFADVIHFDGDTMKAFAGGDVVVIGSTSQALGDYILTPNGRYPGVFSNLRLMDQLMRNRFIERVPPAIDIALILLIPLFVGFAVTQLRPALGIGLALGIVVLYTIFGVLLYGYTLDWLNLLQVDGATVVAALFVALYRVVTEGTDKRVIKEMFGKHVSPALVEEMMKHDDPLKALDLSGKRVKVTIFYSDIRGFTAMSEKMSPEQIYAQLNEYFEEMCKIVFAHGGYVDKFIGDCLMAVFSAPNPRLGNEDAYHAVLSAWEQQQKILDMMTAWAAEGRQIFTVGMGLNTGEVVMGNLGSSDRLNYTVIGDNVNTAARLYNVAKGGQTIISESTYEEVKDYFVVNELTPVFVKGKTLPLRNFEIIGRLEPGQVNTSTLLDPDNLPEAAVADAH